MWRKGLLLAAGAVMVGGCLAVTVKKETVYVPVPATTQPSAYADLEARYRAAMQIVAFPDRDAVLARVAGDAASAGDVAVVRRALNSMTSFLDRDRACEDAAMELSRRGMRAEATDVARMITTFPKRDRVMARLATQ